MNNELSHARWVLYANRSTACQPRQTSLCCLTCSPIYMAYNAWPYIRRGVTRFSIPYTLIPRSKGRAHRPIRSNQCLTVVVYDFFDLSLVHFFYLLLYNRTLRNIEKVLCTNDPFSQNQKYNTGEKTIYSSIYSTALFANFPPPSRNTVDFHLIPTIGENYVNLHTFHSWKPGIVMSSFIITSSFLRWASTRRTNAIPLRVL